MRELIRRILRPKLEAQMSSENPKVAPPMPKDLYSPSYASFKILAGKILSIFNAIFVI